MTPIKIPDTCKPDSTIILGYSGGMALYVAHWESVLCLFEYTNVPLLAHNTIHHFKETIKN